MDFLNKLFGKPTIIELHAKHFAKNAFDFIEENKFNLPRNEIIKKAVDHEMFTYKAVLISLLAADIGSILKFGIDNNSTKKLLKTMTLGLKKIDPAVITKLQDIHHYVKQITKPKRFKGELITIRDAHGLWLLSSIGVVKDNSIFFEIDTYEINLKDKEAAEIIGQWLFGYFTAYWDNIPDYSFHQPPPISASTDYSKVNKIEKSYPRSNVKMQDILILIEDQKVESFILAEIKELTILLRSEGFHHKEKEKKVLYKFIETFSFALPNWNKEYKKMKELINTSF